MGKGSAPAPDPKIGEAAMLSAQTGQDYLQMMKEQSAISNKISEDGYKRYQETFIPLEDDYLKQVREWGSTERLGQQADQAGLVVRNQMAQQQEANKRQLASMGVSPSSGAAIESTNRVTTAGALAEVGARNKTVADGRTQALGLQASAINLGKGLEVNPGSALGLSNSALNSGFQGAMQGYNQQGNLLNQQHQAQMQQWQAKQQAGGSLWGGIGSLVGAFWPSDEDVKENKTKPKKSARRSIDNMRVEEWDYKEGAGDGGHHIGPYAQEFQKETGLGDGKTIMAQDAIGVTMGAVKELSGEVKRLARQIEGRGDTRSAPRKAETRAPARKAREIA